MNRGPCSPCPGQTRERCIVLDSRISDLLGLIFRFPAPWVLTGAGISTESGIPDFRSPGTGLWEKMDPMEFSSVEGLRRNPRAFFTHGLQTIDTILNAQPNTGHIVLGQLQQARLIGPIVTQNVDDLHRRGGAIHYYEVHGHFRTASCMSCRNQVPISEVVSQVERGQIPPVCGYCGGTLKPDVVLFGDMMPADYQEASLLAGRYQYIPKLMIVIGSSLTVSPVNYLPLEFNRIAIINNTPTPMDYKADLVLREQIGEVMGGLWDEIVALNEGNSPEPVPYGFNFGHLIAYLDNEMRFLAGQKTRMTASRESLARHTGYIKADLEAAQSIIQAFPAIGRQPLEKAMLQFYLAEIERMNKEFAVWSSETGIEPNAEQSRLNKLLQDNFKDNVNAFLTYTNETEPLPDLVEHFAACAAGCFGFWSFSSRILGLPVPLQDEWENFKKTAKKHRVRQDLDQFLELFSP
jgi:NAD-dependent deacetylase